MNELLRAALDRAAIGLKENPQWVKTVVNPRRVQAYVTGTLKETGKISRLRLDWEIDNSFIDKLGEKHEAVVDLMIAQMENDLDDLIENGDVNKSTDPLYNVLDGTKKRGRPPTDVDIIEIVPLAERVERKNSTEFTVFILLYTNWD